MLATIPQVYGQVAQTNLGVALGAVPADHLQVLINKTLPLTDPLDIVAAAYKVWRPTKTCFNWQQGILYTSTSTEPLPFSYVLCNFYPMSFWSVGPGTIFPAYDNQDGAMGATCKEMYNLTTPSLEYLEKRYKFSVENILKTERMLFTVNEYDPVTSCAPIQLIADQVANTNRNASRMLYVQNSAHTEDSLSSTFFRRLENATFRPTILQAQQEELQIITEWL